MTMPEISLFFGIRITIYYNDHNPPHIHAEYAGQKALIDIQNASVLKGFLPGRQLKIVLAWCVLYQDELMQNWELVKEGKEPNPAHLKKIIDLALEKNIHMIFIQSQFDVNNAESVAKQIGGQIIQIDPLTENWTAEMNRLIDTLDKYLPEK